MILMEFNILDLISTITGITVLLFLVYKMVEWIDLQADTGIKEQERAEEEIKKIKAEKKYWISKLKKER